MNLSNFRRPSVLRLLVLPVVAAAPLLAGADGTSAAPDAAADAAPNPAARAARAPGAAPAAPRAGAVTEQEATAVIREVENAARARSVDRLAAALAEDATIELRTTFGGRENATQLSKAEYVGMLTSGYAALRDLEGYDYVVADLVLAPDGGAMIAQSRVLEAATFGGRTSVTESRETARLERRGDRVLITAVTATTTAAPPPTPPPPAR